MSKHIRKIIAILMMLIMMMAFVACEKKDESSEEQNTTDKTGNTTSESNDSEIIKEEPVLKYVVENIDYNRAESWVNAEPKEGNLKSEQVYMRKKDSESGKSESICLEEIKYDTNGEVEESIVHNKELLDDYREKNKVVVRKSQDIKNTVIKGDESKSMYIINYNSGAYIEYKYTLLLEEWQGDIFEISIKEYDDDYKFVKGTKYLYTYNTLTSSIAYWDENDEDNNYIETVFTYYDDEENEENVVIQGEVEAKLKKKTVVVSKYDVATNQNIVNTIKEVNYDEEGNVVQTNIYNQELLNEYENRNFEIVKNDADIVDIEIERGNKEDTYKVYYDSGEYVVCTYSIYDSIIGDVEYKDRNEQIVVAYYDSDGVLIKCTNYFLEYGVLTEVYESWGEEGWTDDFVQIQYSYYDAEKNCEVADVYGGKVVINDGEAYLQMGVNNESIPDEIIYSYGEEKYQEWLQLVEKYPECEIEGYGKIKGIKLDVSNVKTVVENVTGHDTSFSEEGCGFFILHNDNTVSFYYMPNALEGKGEVKKLDVNNVVDIIIVSTNGSYTYFVDSEGNMTIADMYIK